MNIPNEFRNFLKNSIKNECEKLKEDKLDDEDECISTRDEKGKIYNNDNINLLASMYKTNSRINNLNNLNNLNVPYSEHKNINIEEEITMRKINIVPITDNIENCIVDNQNFFTELNEDHNLIKNPKLNFIQTPISNKMKLNLDNSKITFNNNISINDSHLDIINKFTLKKYKNKSNKLEISHSINNSNNNEINKSNDAYFIEEMKKELIKISKEKMDLKLELNKIKISYHHKNEENQNYENILQELYQMREKDREYILKQEKEIGRLSEIITKFNKKEKMNKNRKTKEKLEEDIYNYLKREETVCETYDVKNS